MVNEWHIPTMINIRLTAWRNTSAQWEHSARAAVSIISDQRLPGRCWKVEGRGRSSVMSVWFSRERGSQNIILDPTLHLIKKTALRGSQGVRCEVNALTSALSCMLLLQVTDIMIKKLSVGCFKLISFSRSIAWLLSSWCLHSAYSGIIYTKKQAARN